VYDKQQSKVLLWPFLFFDLHNFHSNLVTQNFIRAIFTLAPAQRGAQGAGKQRGEMGGKALAEKKKICKHN